MLETDASIHGLGAVLAQKQADGKVHPIAYASRSLNCHERNYGITELETLGLVWAARLFRPYLLGHKCIVYTDHSACTSLLNRSHPSAKLARWALIIQELDLEIKHRPGKSNMNVDALSRNPPAILAVSAAVASDSASGNSNSGTSQESELSRKQRQDPDFSGLFRYMRMVFFQRIDSKPKEWCLSVSSLLLLTVCFTMRIQIFLEYGGLQCHSVCVKPY